MPKYTNFKGKSDYKSLKQGSTRFGNGNYAIVSLSDSDSDDIMDLYEQPLLS